MTILDLLSKSIPSLAGLKSGLQVTRDALAKAKEAAPDMALYFDARITELDNQISTLDTIADPAGLAALAVTVVHELSGLKHGLSPKPHAGDVTGG